VVLARGAAFALRLAGNLVRSLSRVVITLYDVVIVLPLLVERLLSKKQNVAVDDEDLAVRRH